MLRVHAESLQQLAARLQARCRALTKNVPSLPKFEQFARQRYVGLQIIPETPPLGHAKHVKTLTITV
jgi:hypothetical protein